MFTVKWSCSDGTIQPRPFGHQLALVHVDRSSSSSTYPERRAGKTQRNFSKFVNSLKSSNPASTNLCAKKEKNVNKPVIHSNFHRETK